MRIHKAIVGFLAGCVALALVLVPIRAQQQAETLNPAYTGPPPISRAVKDFVPVTAEMLLHPRADNWITFRNGYSRWGYSALNQINDGNVAQLRMVWSRESAAVFLPPLRTSGRIPANVLSTSARVGGFSK